MHELALFAGAGGGILGGLLRGWRTVAAVEIEDYPRRVLLQRQADGILPRFPIWDDVCTFDGKPWRGKVDIVTGGFPCQDISAAGKGKGLAGKRSGLWTHMARIIGEVKPRYVLVENSPMLTSRGLDRILMDLAQMGYNAKWGVLGAHHAGAPHKRDRIWIVANAGVGRCGKSKKREMELQGGAETICPGKDVADPGRLRCSREESQIQAGRNGIEHSSSDVADTNCTGRKVHVAGGDEQKKPITGGVGRKRKTGQWHTEPAVG